MYQRLLKIRTSTTLGNSHGPLATYVKLWVAHTPGMAGTFPPAADLEGNRQLTISACITARASRPCRDACRDRLPAVAGETFPAFPAHAHLQFYVSGNRPMAWWVNSLAARVTGSRPFQKLYINISALLLLSWRPVSWRKCYFVTNAYISFVATDCA